MRASERHLYLYASAVLVLLLLGWWLSRPEPVAVVTAPVERGTVEETVANTRTGTVEPCHRARLSPATAGQIAALPVREGERVGQGQLLLRLWNDDLRAQLALAKREARAAGAQAEASCLQAEEALREARRLEALHETGAVSQEEVDHATTRARAAGAQCQAARASAGVSSARIEVARARLEQTLLRAPFAGLVARIEGEVAEYVTPAPAGTAPAVVELIDDACFYLSAPIDEIDAPRIRPGMPAHITLDAFPDRHFPGRVRRVADFVLTEARQARTVEVEVAFDEATTIEGLLPGYSADAEIVVRRHDDVLRIPTEALLEGGAVLVLADGVLEWRAIETGLGNWDWTEVRAGLAEGERVVTSLDREGVVAGVRAREETEPRP